MLTVADLVPFRGRSPWLHHSLLLCAVRVLVRDGVLSCRSARCPCVSVWDFPEVYSLPHSSFLLHLQHSCRLVSLHGHITKGVSSSLACPVIWGRRYGWLASSSILLRLLRCLLSTPASVISLLHASLHRMFGRPLLLFLGMSASSILLTMSSSIILLIWSYHFSRFSVTFSDACTALVVPLMCLIRFVSLHVTPHRYRHHTTELVGPQFCKPFHSVSLAYSCHTTLNCFYFSFSMLHSISV